VWDEARAHAAQWLDGDPVFLDVETTGLSDSDQVVEIAIVDACGGVLLESLVRPTVPVSPEATAVHGITAAELAGAPSWTAIAPRVRALLAGARVICHGAHFDARLVEQTCRAHGIEMAQAVAWDCTLNLLTPANDGRWPRLSVALDLAGAKRPNDGRAHRATYDAECCRRIVCALATARTSL